MQCSAQTDTLLVCALVQRAATFTVLHVLAWPNVSIYKSLTLNNSMLYSIQKLCLFKSHASSLASKVTLACSHYAMRTLPGTLLPVMLVREECAPAAGRCAAAGGTQGPQ